MRRVVLALIAPILFVALWGCSAATSVEEPPEEPPGTETTSLTVIRNAASTATEPDLIIAGTAAAAEYWFDRSNDPVQALFTSADGTVRVRAKYDEDGILRVVSDELSNTHIQIIDNGPERIDYWIYDGNDNWQDGFAIFQESNGYYWGRIVSAPAYAMQQIVGQMDFNASTQTGSFALTADNDIRAGLADVRPVPNEIISYLSQRSAGAQVLRPQSSGVSFDKSDAVIIGGLTVLVVGASTPVVATAGVVLTGFYMLTKVIEAVTSTAHSVLDAAGAMNRNGCDESNGNGYQLGIMCSGDPSGPVEIDSLNTVPSDFRFDLGSRIDDDQFPSSTDTPPASDGTVSGRAVFQDNSVHTLDGSIMGDGSFDVQDQSGNLTINGSVDSASGDVTGTFSSTSGSGTVTGSAQALGSCSVNQGSGGRGTFSFAHSVGFGAGAVTFYYDAYTIPDAFTVSTANGVKFTTGGLVSGSASISIPIDNEPTVFINVSAPRSGTLWEYNLGCL